MLSLSQENGMNRLSFHRVSFVCATLVVTGCMLCSQYQLWSIERQRTHYAERLSRLQKLGRDDGMSEEAIDRVLSKMPSVQISDVMRGSWLQQEIIWKRFRAIQCGVLAFLLASNLPLILLQWRLQRRRLAEVKDGPVGND